MHKEVSFDKPISIAEYKILEYIQSHFDLESITIYRVIHYIPILKVVDKQGGYLYFCKYMNCNSIDCFDTIEEIAENDLPF